MAGILGSAHGERPHDVRPWRTPSQISGPPESPAQVSLPPAISPAHSMTSVTFSGWALAHTSLDRSSMYTHWRSSGYSSGWIRRQEGGEQTPAPSSLPPHPAVLLGPDLHLMGAVLPQPEARQVLPTVGSSLGRSMTFTTSVSSAGLLRWSSIRSLL